MIYPFQQRPRIHVYTVAWNEAKMAPFFFRYYCPLAEKVIVWDKLSDDGTDAIAATFPNVEVRRYDNNAGLFSEESNTAYKNTVWKESRGKADWVLLLDFDEFIYHHNLLSYLGVCKQRGVTMPIVTGYQMLSHSFPKGDRQIMDYVKTGCLSGSYTKQVVIDPDWIDETNYGGGSHTHKASGKVVTSHTAELKLLHYKFLGVEYVDSRNRELRDRRFNDSNKPKSLGDVAGHWWRTRERVQEKLEEWMRDATDVVTPLMPTTAGVGYI